MCVPSGCICEEAEKVYSESISPYLASILEVLTENISAGIQGMQQTLHSQMDSALKSTNGGSVETKKVRNLKPVNAGFSCCGLTFVCVCSPGFAQSALHQSGSVLQAGGELDCYSQRLEAAVWSDQRPEAGSLSTSGDGAGMNWFCRCSSPSKAFSLCHDVCCVSSSCWTVLCTPLNCSSNHQPDWSLLKFL